MTRAAFLISLLCATCLTFGCAKAEPLITRTLTEQDNGKAITVAVGQPIEVVLAGNPTTGYRWGPARGDTGVIKETREPDYITESDAMGAGGTFTFHFQADTAGQGWIRLEYRRPWETDTPAEKTYEVTVEIED
jgi:inhibitor of cysteine peptidase